MQKIGNVRWDNILLDVATRIENQHHVKILIDSVIVCEVGRLICMQLESIGLEKPNIAKIAGQVAFWIRKLKPLYISQDSPNKLLTVNELAALHIGLALCLKYRDDNSKVNPVRLPPRIFRDWVSGFRYHSHSPHSSMTSFELLMCDA